MMFVGLTGVACAIITACETSVQGDEQWSSREFVPAEPLATVEPTLAPAPTASPAPAMTLDQMKSSALDVLYQAADSGNPLMLANAIEAMKAYPDGIRPIVRRGLVAENRGVRFVSAMVVGELQLKDMQPLVEPLMLDESDSVRAAAMYAKQQFGANVDLSPLATMLRSESAEVKGNAAFVLGELGEPSAIPMLRQSMGRGLARESTTRARIVDLQIAEALVKLGADQHLDGIRSALFSPAEQAELILLACQICGDLEVRGAVADLHNLANRTGDRELPPEVRLAAALALARIDASSAPINVPLGYATDDRPDLRAQAAVALGATGSRQTLPALRTLMSDSSEAVRVSAAGGILQIR
ncbi:MAG: HEAT repeat domain-containing protein [Planctomycetota bacterium]